ncbi:Uncharacterized protein QTN25_005442 [Entamoeba marina]
MCPLVILTTQTDSFSFPLDLILSPRALSTSIYDLCQVYMDSEENVTLSLDCGTNALLEYQVVVNYIEDNPLVMYNKSKERILEQLGILIKHGVSIVEVMNYLMVDNQTEIMRLLVKGMNKELARIITTRNYEEDREIFYNVMSSNKKKTLDIQPRYEDLI